MARTVQRLKRAGIAYDHVQNVGRHGSRAAPPGTQGWIDPASGLISLLLIQRADSGTDSLRNVFLTMAEASVGH